MPAPRTLLPYQARWVRDPSSLKVCVKSRRIGISWAEAYAAVMHAGENRGDVRYQAYSREAARDWIGDCAAWAEALELGAAAIGETLIDADDAGAVRAFAVRLRSGRRILAMPATPRAWRGKGRPGELAIIDEAAWVDDIDAVLAAALATQMWGGQVHVISTHHGEGSPFDHLGRDILSGRRPGSAHTITFADAVADGLCRRICAVTGETWSAEAEAAWVAQVRGLHGEHATEELDCIPEAGGAAWLSWPLIYGVEHADAGRPSHHEGGVCGIGVDIARRRDLWVAWVVEQCGDVLWTREVVAARDLTFRAQADEIERLVRRYAPLRVVYDQTGMGEAVVEEAQRRYGASAVEGVLMTAPRQLDLASALRERFEDRAVRIPADDADLRADLRAVRRVAGPTGAPRLVTERTGDGHADRFWALALAVGALSGGVVRPEYIPVRLDRRRTDRGRDDNLDDDARAARPDWYAPIGSARGIL